MTVASNLRQLRDRAGLTIDQLAVRTGLFSHHLHAIESGRESPSPYAMDAIERCLKAAGVGEDDLARLRAATSTLSAPLVLPAPPGLAVVTWLSVLFWVPLPVLLAVLLVADAAVVLRFRADPGALASLVGLIAFCAAGACTALLVRRRKRWAWLALVLLYRIVGSLGLINIGVAVFGMALPVLDRRVVWNAALLAVAGAFLGFYDRHVLAYYIDGVTRESLRADLASAPSKALSAVWALSTVSDDEARSTLIGGLSHQDASVRLAIVGALGREPSGEAVAALARAADDGDRFVKDAAVKALRGRTGPGAS